MPFFSGLARSIAKHGPDGVIALGLLGAYMWGIKNGYDAMGLYGIVVIVWAGFITLRIVRYRHLERVEEIEVKKIEAQGKNLKFKYRQKQKSKAKP